MIEPGNLRDDAAAPSSGERFDTLLRHRNLHVERIISSQDMTPTACEQAQDEWVLLVEGAATLEIAGQVVRLKPGDHVFLPAHTPHMVLEASQGAMWLAVHLHPTGEQP